MAFVIDRGAFVGNIVRGGGAHPGCQRPPVRQIASHRLCPERRYFAQCAVATAKGTNRPSAGD